MRVIPEGQVAPGEPTEPLGLAPAPPAPGPDDEVLQIFKSCFSDEKAVGRVFHNALWGRELKLFSKFEPVRQGASKPSVDPDWGCQGHTRNIWNINKLWADKIWQDGTCKKLQQELEDGGPCNDLEAFLGCRPWHVLYPGWCRCYVGLSQQRKQGGFLWRLCQVHFPTKGRIQMQSGFVWNTVSGFNVRRKSLDEERCSST